MSRRSSGAAAAALALVLAAAPAPAQDAQPQDQLTQQVEALEKAAGADPARARRIVAEAERLKALAAGKQELIDRLDVVVGAAKKSVSGAADRAFETLSGDVKKALDNDGEPTAVAKGLDQALASIDRFDPVFAEAKAKDVDALKRHVLERRLVARNVQTIFEKLERMTAAEAWDRALGLLKSFEVVAYLKDSPWKGKADKLVAELQQKKGATKGDDGWDVIFGGASLQNLDVAHGDCWKVDENEGTATCEAETDTACFFGDADTWGDLDLEVEMVIGKIGLELKLRDGPDGVDRPDAAAIRVPDYETSTIFRVRVSLKGRQGKLVRLDTFDTRTFELGRDKGRIGFVFPQGSAVAIRYIKVKLHDAGAKHFPKDERKVAEKKEEPKPGKGKKGKPGKPERPQPKPKDKPKKGDDDGDD